tara:strand:+ start:6371 stop:7753 length:1383 start_codon:yes stop_codon:yes gene_type:complete
MPAAIPIAAAVAGSAASTAMSKGSSKSGDQTVTTKQQIDPRIADLLYGTGRTLKPGVAATYAPSTSGSQIRNPNPYRESAANISKGDGQWQYSPEVQGAQTNPESDYTNDPGFLNKIMALLDQQQKPGMSAFGTGIDNYLNDYGRPQFDNTMRAAAGLMTGNTSAPQMSAAQMQAAQINAPKQNDLGLAPAFQDMIYGEAGNNPYLTGAIQKGINQSNNAFGNMLTDATKNLTQGVLPDIRRGSILNGQFGGSRQGLAEGKALDSFNTQIGRALSQVGQNNTDAAVGAQAGAYDADRSRALSALGNLNSNQYGVATNNAQFQQQANQSNAGWQNSANQANLQAQLGTNQLNSANTLAGINSTSNLLGQAYNYGTNNDAYNLNKTASVSSILSPYTGLGGGQTQTQPLYSNTAGNLLGGATAGLGLYDAYNKATTTPVLSPGVSFDASSTVRDPIRGSYGY